MKLFHIGQALKISTSTTRSGRGRILSGRRRRIGGILIRSREWGKEEEEAEEGEGAASCLPRRRGAEDDGPGPMPSPAEVFKKTEPRFSLTVTKEGRVRGPWTRSPRACSSSTGTSACRLCTPDQTMQSSRQRTTADAVQAIMCLLGWTVTVNPIWARYEMTVPAQLAGTSPKYTGLVA